SVPGGKPAPAASKTNRTPPAPGGRSQLAVVGPVYGPQSGAVTHASPSQYSTVSVEPAGTSVERTDVAEKWSQKSPGFAGSAGSWTTTWSAFVVDPSGPNGRSRDGSWRMTLCPGTAGKEDGEMSFAVSVARRATSVSSSSLAVAGSALGTVASTVLGWTTSSTSWSGSVSAVKGTDASAPVMISPVNSTEKPTTVQPSGGLGSVFGAPASSTTGSALSAHVNVTVAAVAPAGHVTPVPSPEGPKPVNVSGASPSNGLGVPGRRLRESQGADRGAGVRRAERHRRRVARAHLGRVERLRRRDRVVRRRDDVGVGRGRRLGRALGVGHGGRHVVGDRRRVRELLDRL